MGQRILSRNSLQTVNVATSETAELHFPASEKISNTSDVEAVSCQQLAGLSSLSSTVVACGSPICVL